LSKRPWSGGQRSIESEDDVETVPVPLLRNPRKELLALDRRNDLVGDGLMLPENQDDARQLGNLRDEFGLLADTPFRDEIKV
jgi:hypothetical protein